ncbi:hypothetical protein KAT92_05080 [Candidatus Babeliales bacterium]|nr:hypothetical protein [Candidatus Babeliales bacterium]
MNRTFETPADFWGWLDPNWFFGIGAVEYGASNRHLYVKFYTLGEKTNIHLDVFRIYPEEMLKLSVDETSLLHKTNPIGNLKWLKSKL